MTNKVTVNHKLTAQYINNAGGFVFSYNRDDIVRRAGFTARFAIDPGKWGAISDYEEVTEKLDQIVITHRHIDHYVGVEEILRATPGIELICPEIAGKTLLKLLRKNGATPKQKVTTPESKERMLGYGVFLTMFPSSHGTYDQGLVWRNILRGLSSKERFLQTWRNKWSIIEWSSKREKNQTYSPYVEFGDKFRFLFMGSPGIKHLSQWEEAIARGTMKSPDVLFLACLGEKALETGINLRKIIRTVKPKEVVFHHLYDCYPSPGLPLFEEEAQLALEQLTQQKDLPKMTIAKPGEEYTWNFQTSNLF